MKILKPITKRVFLFLMAAVILVACQTTDMPSLSDQKSDTGDANIVPARYAASTGARVVEYAPGLIQSNASVKIFTAPDLASSVIDTLSPMKEIYVLDYSIDGSFLAINTMKYNLKPSGWISMTDAIARSTSSEVRGLVKVHDLPMNYSQIINVLTPVNTVFNLGKSWDGNFYAIAQSSGDQFSVGWIRVGDLQMEPRSARILTLVHTYLRADPLSPVYNVLTPYQLVDVLGQNQEGTLLAVASSDQHKFLGWIAASDLEYSSEGFDPPVISY